MRPLPSKNGPGGPYDLLPNTKKQKKYPKSQCPNGRARRRSPGPHSGAGRVRRPRGMPRATTGPPLLVGVKKPQNTTEGVNKNNRKKNDQNTHAASRPEKGPRKGRASSSPVSFRRIPKTRRAQNGTPTKTPRSRTHRQKRAKKQMRRGKKEQEQTNTGACGGVLLLPDICLFLKRKKQTKTKMTSAKNLRKRERTPKKQT